MLLWILVGSLTIAALAPLLWPLLTRRPDRAPDSSAPSDPLIAVYLDRRREIERERTAGRLDPAEAEAALDELAAQMARDLPPELATANTQPQPIEPNRRPSGAARLIALVLALLVPGSALLVYLGLGSPELADRALMSADQPLDDGKLDAMIADLERRVRAQPDDGEAWMMLAGARKFRGLPAAANDAFEEALRRVPPSARLLAEFAESLALVRDGRFAGRPVALLEQALRLDPDDPKAVALMGAAQYQAGNLAEARTYLRKLLDSFSADSPEREALRDLLARIDAQVAQSSTSSPSSTSAGALGEMISGSVDLDPSMAERATRMRTLFIFARLPSGPRLPLAALRVDTPSLPLEFKLDDSLAMDPSRKLSSAGEVVIEARLSASGNAIREPGDLYGESQVVKPGTQGLKLRIDKVVQP
jgi:cytochrome c-type biogenesis protein CcmH